MTNIVKLSAPTPAVEANETTRELTGVVLPWDTFGDTSAGKVKAQRGAVRIPQDLSRIKLLDWHSGEPGTPPPAIGYATAAEDTAKGLVMTFRIGNTTAATEALQAAKDGLRDSFSVELFNVAQHRDEITAADLTAVALVPIPAFKTARITRIAASHQGATPMTSLTPEQLDRLTDLQRRLSAAEEVANDEVIEALNLTVALAAELAGPSDDSGDDSGDAPETVNDDSEATAAAPPVKVAAARAPATLRAGHRRAPKLANLFSTVAGMHGGHRSAQITAALQDITLGANPWTSRDQYAGELWSGNTYSPQFYPLLTQAQLAGRKVVGWRFVQRPEVAPWAGNKTDVPSNAVTTEAAETTAKYLAGAWDIGREFYDFGETEFIEAVYRAAANDIARKLDQAALMEIIAYASGHSTDEDGGAALTGKNLLEAVLVGADHINGELNGVEPSFVLVHPADWRTLLTTPASDKPFMLEDLLGIAPTNFKRSTAVEQGTVIVGSKSAATFYTLAQSPIRVQAVDMERGGLDTGVFAYYATLLNDPRGVVQVAIQA